jgi:hypothetical protein
MSDWKFWVLAARLTAQLVTLLSIRTAMAELWAKLHEMQQVLVNAIARRREGD